MPAVTLESVDRVLFGGATLIVDWGRLKLTLGGASPAPTKKGGGADQTSGADETRPNDTSEILRSG
jgi:hypothetical protein